MKELNFLDFKKNVVSQNGEDGIIEKIFELIGPGEKICCEFGSWDGIHLSNTRNLITQGWSAVLIEGNPVRHREAIANYKENPKVFCVNSFVDSGNNSLSTILNREKLGKEAKNMDFLSIDIDGLDYEIFRTLDISPRVICVEVNAGHSPTDTTELPKKVAATNIGQSLAVFQQIAEEKGYSLLVFSGNAFYLRNDVQKKFDVPTITPEKAYDNFLKTLSVPEKEWLYLVNLGIVPPYYSYRNSLLSAENLEISSARASWLRVRTRIKNAIYGLGKAIIRPVR